MKGRDGSREKRLAECIRLWEETGGLDHRADPGLRAEMEANLRVARSLAALKPERPAPAAAATSRRLLLSALASGAEAAPALPRLVLGRVAAAWAALALLAFGALGASAAAGGPSPLPGVLETLGVTGGSHGQGVRQAVEDARNSGEPVGPAACAAAHDRATLPTPAPRTPPGREGKEPLDCAQGNGGGEEEQTGTSQQPEEALDNHGQNVKEAVEDAKEASEPVGPAACEAAHDRSTLPPQAPATPPGQEGKDQQQCGGPGGNGNAGNSAGNGGNSNAGNSAGNGGPGGNSRGNRGGLD